MKFVFTIFTITCLLAACGVKSTTGTNNASSGSGTRVVDASQQRIMYGARGSEPRTEYRFTLLWKEPNAPYQFLFKGEKGWLTGRFDITKGDTVYVMASRTPTFKVEIQTDQRNVLYYNTQNSSWKAIQPASIKKLPDVVAP